jgi:hypothetical protein
VVFIPGRVAGKHPLTLDIPGIGTITNTTFSVTAGVPMYMTPDLSDTTFSFTLRDRYGNIAPRNIQGLLSRNAEAATSITFTEGVARIPRTGGYYTMRVPELEDNTIVLTDTNGVYTIQGIPYAVLYVPNQSNQYEFLPDYNARYTVLAGDAFLREGEDILYDVIP